MGSLASFLACLVVGVVASAAHATDYTEGTDLSNTFSAPTDIGALTLGSNLLTGSVNTNTELDYVTFTVPAGHLLSQIQHTQYASSNATSFMGMQTGSAFTKPATGTGAITAPDLLGFVHFGTATDGTDVLDDMGDSSVFGAQGFTPPLTAGPYTLWIQQTSNVTTTYQFDLVVSPVPEPHCLALVLLGASVVPAVVRRRRA
jgi:hypothetical protein